MGDELSAESPRVAIAGATGFVGQALAERLRDEAHVVGLSRSDRTPSERGPHQWRSCDLFSHRQITEALEGIDVAYYLVHSMMPSARLTQADFADLDLILADNFGRAAKTAGVQRIIYLGGLLPTDGALSRHLDSRREVEQALGAHGVDVTTLRAGLVVGREGSSTRILIRLVARLPILVCPAWTKMPTQPIALEDAVAALAHCLGDAGTTNQTFDIGGPEVVSYRKMLGDTADALGRKRLMLSVPLVSPGLSRLWVSLVTGMPRALVGPLIESLRHPMVARDRSLQQQRMKRNATPWPEAIAAAVQTRQALPSKRAGLVKRQQKALREQRLVRSVQRLHRPAEWTPADVAREYLKWLPGHR